jgi:hypothetical protein
LRLSTKQPSEKPFLSGGFKRRLQSIKARCSGGLLQVGLKFTRSDKRCIAGTDSHGRLM